MTIPLWLAIPMVGLTALGLVAVIVILAVICDVTQNPQYDR